MIAAAYPDTCEGVLALLQTQTDLTPFELVAARILPAPRVGVWQVEVSGRVFYAYTSEREDAPRDVVAEVMP